ncbi:MAG TPA: metal ABC transporter permease [Gemmatimonadales bacterium]|nr:metal ABC transporter permease [Gemmatimonadales bacterium]
MSDLIQVMAAPFAASMVLVAMLAYLGVHVIAREVIFVDLALAQMAALGATSASLFSIAPDSLTGYAFALGFATLGAFIFAATRTRRERRRVPHEAIIGIVYVIATAASILVADQAPAGAETIKEVLVGSILWVTWPAIGKLTTVYAALAVLHWLLRERFLTISLAEADAERRGWNVRWWDFVFYLLFGIAITLAVPIAGVLLVFTFLVVPAVVAFLFTRRTALLIALSWTSSAVASAVGLGLSFRYDLPTGPLIVCMFGVVLLLAGAVRWSLTARGVA